MQRLPAGRTKLVWIGGDNAAAGTSRRKREIDYRPQWPHQRLHLPLVPHKSDGHKQLMQSTPPQLFDYRRRRALRERAIARTTGQSFLWTWLADEIADRLACTTRQFERTLILGPLAANGDILSEAKLGDVICLPTAEEDQLGQDTESFDLIIAAGTLDSVNDLPGALVQIRRALKPDGLFLGALFGAGSLGALKRAMMIADADSVRAHVHPQVELRSAADLLARTGFNLQVADRSGLDVRYGDWRSLVRDLRDAGIGNCLASRAPFLGKHYLQRLDLAWAQLADSSGKVAESFEVLHLSGWSPSASQAKPAARGSGQISLVKLLDKSGKL